MPPLSQLLDVQTLDLESDRLAERRRTLPERAELQQTLAQAAALDREHAELRVRFDALSRSEHTLGAEVAEVAAKAKEVEDVLYSGIVKAPKELEALQQEIQLTRERQSGLEEQEMALLEEIEQTDADMAANRAERVKRDEGCAALEATIRASETEIDGELASLAGKRAEMIVGLPEPILVAYARLRENERLVGRAAAQLADGSCSGCHVKLPVLEYNRMKAEPADALVCCVHCGRVLVR